MPRVRTVHIARHGTRQDFLTKTFISPTGLPKDPPLAAEGFSQASQLSSHLLTVHKSITHVFSSPFSRCLQTIEPFVRERGVRVKIEPGLGEWFNIYYKDNPAVPPPKAPTVEVLDTLFGGMIDTSYPPQWTSGTRWETQDEIHERVKWTIERIIQYVETSPEMNGADEPESVEILLVTHAAVQIAAGRGLLGSRTAGITCGVATLGRFERQEAKDGTRKLGGKWEMVLNGDAKHLKHGLQYNWAFWGDTLTDSEGSEGTVKTSL
ncbi:histidine phosphatase superfamily [Phlyctochytrium arcticum]|nr:histidine phosphatase superfamily [Phlyctochytrium arcticum]